MGRKPNRSQGEEERDWREMSTIGRIYVSSEVIMYSIADIIEMTGWMTVQKLFNDPQFPSANYGKKKVIENHALMQFFSVRRDKERDNYWR